MGSPHRPEGLPASVFVHDRAFVESADIGEQTRVWGFAHVMKGVRVGSHCNLGEQVFLETGAIVGDRVTVKNGISIWDKVVIEDDVFLGPHLVFTNDMKPRAFIKRGGSALVPTLVKKGATIGAGAVIVCGVTIGEYAFIGAGAVVTKTVPAHARVLGNPGYLSDYVCVCAGQNFKLDAAPAAGSLRCDSCRTLKV